MKSTTKYILPILIITLLWLYSLDRVRLGQSIPDEKRYFQSTKEMIETGDYITPRYHGELRFQKPILFYWLILLSYKIFGIGFYGARFPSILAGIINVVMTYFLGRILFSKRTGIISALVLSTCEVFLMYSRFASPDMVFLMFIVGAIFSFAAAYLGRIGGRHRYLYMYIFMALAMITKGPLGVIYPLLLIIFFLAVQKELVKLKEINLLPGSVLFIAISAPWFIAMFHLHGSHYFDNVWTLEILKKTAVSTSGSFLNILLHYTKNLFYYIGMAFARHLPWSLFLPASLAALSYVKIGKEESVGYKFILSWFTVAFVSLIFIWSKESYYVLALSVPTSLLLGKYLSDVSIDDFLCSKGFFKILYIIFIAVFIIAVILVTIFMVIVMDRPQASLSLLLFIIPLFMIQVYRKGRRVLIPIALYLCVMAGFAYSIGYLIPIVDDEPIARMVESIKDDVTEDVYIATASPVLSRHRINALFSGHDVIRADKCYFDEFGNKVYIRDRSGLISRFLSQIDRKFYCMISGEDYDKYVAKELQERLKLVKTAYIWKKFHKEDKAYFKKLIDLILRGDISQFRASLKDTAYLVTNISE